MTGNEGKRVVKLGYATVRLFFAVELPDEVSEAVAARGVTLRGEFPDAGARWSRTENLHLTLKFLGDVEAIRFDALCHAAAAATASLAPFTLSIEGTGTFPPHGTARVLWLGVRDDDRQLARLRLRLDDECAQVGFPPESRHFRPHLTLARLSAPRGSDEPLYALSEAHRRALFGPHAFRVSDLVLMRSELRPDGPRYTPLSRHTF